MNLPDIPKYITDYFNFTIDFTGHTSEALKPFKERNKIDETLVSYAAFGLFFTWLIAFLLRRLAEMHKDKTSLFKNLHLSEIEIYPLAAIFAIIVCAIILHFAIKIVLAIDKRFMHQRSPKKYPDSGTFNLKNTINGLLAFFAVIPFLYMTLFLLTMFIIYTFLPAQIKPGVVIALIAPTAIAALIFILFHFPRSIAAVHPDSLNSYIRNSIRTLIILSMALIALIDKN